MGQEKLATDFESGQDAKKTGDSAELRETLFQLVSGSRLLGEGDKKAALDWLEKDSASHNPNELKLRIQYFPEAERSVEKQVAAYKKQINEAVETGLFAKKSARAYEEWFLKDLSYEERQKYLKDKNTALHDPKRQKLLDEYKRLPAAAREDLREKFFNADIEERRKIITEATKKHERLKAAFLKLPPETQKKYREKFKASSLRDRELLLKTMSSLDAGKEGLAEKADEEKLTRRFEEKTAKLVGQNLLTPMSKAAYDAWYKSLPLTQKRTMANSSELDARMEERIRARDEFHNLPEKTRGPHELKFRNIDLDRRKAMLAKLAQPQENAGSARYPGTTVRHILEKTLAEPALAQARLLFTMTNRIRVLRRKAEIRHEAKHGEDISKKTAERGHKVDQANVIYLETLRHHGDARGALKRFEIKKQGEGQEAMATNTTLLDENKKEVSAEQFQALVENHLKEELLAGLLNRAASKLPGASSRQMRNAAEKLDLTVDLRKAAA